MNGDLFKSFREGDKLGGNGPLGDRTVIDAMERCSGSALSVQRVDGRWDKGALRKMLALVRSSGKKRCSCFGVGGDSSDHG